MVTLEAVRSTLKQLKTKLGAMYGARFHEMIVYGSYARGEAVDGSDVDILLVLDDVHDPLEERERLSMLLWELSLEKNKVFSVLPMDIKCFRQRQSPLLLNIRREGVVIE